MTKNEINTLKSAAQVLRKLAHPVRLNIIRFINEHPECSAGEIEEAMGTTQSMTSQHLSALKHTGVIDCQKKANVCHFYIKNKNVLRLLDCVYGCTVRS